MNLAAAVIEQNNLIIRNNCPKVQSHVGKDCCKNARNWLVAMARSFDFSVTDGARLAGPGWLKTYYEWGPSAWPVHWCEAVSLPVIDCGLFRAFANLIFAAKGIECFDAQVLRLQQPSSTSHWQKRWDGAANSLPWVSKNFVYHEICAVKTSEGHCELYDPTDGVWLDADITKGHNGHFAVRVESSEVLQWQKQTLGGFQWVSL